MLDPVQFHTLAIALAVRQTVRNRLSLLVEGHNAVHGENPASRVTLEMLEEVYKRAKPGDEMARVTDFLHMLFYGQPMAPDRVFDFDLLPSEHPRKEG